VHITDICSSSHDEDIDDVVARRDSSRNSARLRRNSAQLFGRGNKNNNEDSSDDSDSVRSLHRDPLHRHNLLMWRDNWHPAFSNRLPNIDRNNNDGIYTSHILLYLFKYSTFIWFRLLFVYNICLPFDVVYSRCFYVH